ncbi:hypothetical protein N7462_005507 [Penicillium macrosclerotiorum]|uniref:uncharacterized protein n=1 Tax=Penicillium macrosclerotiorum TaxID=303699 RepID=UPI0025495D73|nr:uncharacterized protein N7462_005507 [Penicillium macrosclerotiorum]KAJ5682342.1 hypothetical protein N7462_005507 [Penicillium macrosclerotiorum]
MRVTESKSTESPHERTAIDSDDDPTSSSGSSSSETESDNDVSDDEDERMHDDNQIPAFTSASSIPSITGRPKPQIHRMEGGSDLLSRLSSFLPKLKDANEDLEREIAAGRGKDMVLDSAGDDGKDYIEMNLGLGVLEEKRDGDNLSGDEGDDESSNEDLEKTKSLPSRNTDSDVLGKLMGEDKSTTDKPSIEEMRE